METNYWYYALGLAQKLVSTLEPAGFSHAELQLIGSIDDVIAAAARILVYLDGRMPESGDFGPAVFIGENSSVAVHKYTPLFIRSSDVKNLEFAPT